MATEKQKKENIDEDWVCQKLNGDHGESTKGVRGQMAIRGQRGGMVVG